MPDPFLFLAAGDSRLQWAALGLRVGVALGTISGFFNALNRDVIGISLSAAAFFFALSAILYMASGATGNERTRTHAVNSLYAALAGVALATLSNTIATLVSHAASGQ